MKIICLLLALFSVSIATSQYTLPSSLKVTEDEATCYNVQSLITTANDELNKMKTIVNDIKTSRNLLSTVKSQVSQACSLATQIKSLNFLETNSRAKSAANMKSSLRKLNNLKTQITQNPLVGEMIGSRLDDIVYQLTEVTAQADIKKIQQTCTELNNAIIDLDNYLKWAIDEINNRWVNGYLPYRVNALTQYSKGCVRGCISERTGQYGGPGGKYFEYADISECGYKLKKINFRFGLYVDAIQLVLSLDNYYEYVFEKRGGNGGGAHIYTPDGTIQKIRMWYGTDYLQYVNGIQFVTDKETTIVHGAANNKMIELSIKGELTGIYGYSGTYIDKLGFKYTYETWIPQVEQISTQAIGNNLGVAFSDAPRDGTYHLSKINIRVGSYINGIQVVFRQGNDKEIQNPWRGVTKGDIYTFTPSGTVAKANVIYDSQIGVNYIEFIMDSGETYKYGTYKTGKPYISQTIDINGEIAGIDRKSVV